MNNRILTCEELSSCVQGALEIESVDDGLKLHRFTAGQRAFYWQTNRDFWMKTQATSCICLEFITDSVYLQMEYAILPGSSRKWYGFDVLADGVMVHHVQGDWSEGDRGSWECALPAGEKRLTVHLPCLSGAVIGSLSLSEGATFVPCRREKKILVFGDSITQGYDAHFPSMAYACALGEEFGAAVTNQGIGAEKFNSGLLTDDLGGDYDLITVAYGTNDWSGRPADEFDAGAKGFYTRLREKFPETPILAIMPLWRRDSERITGAGSFPEAMERLAKIASAVENVTVVDGTRLTPHFPDFYSDQYLHPNDLGYTFYSKNLVDFIRGHQLL